MKTVQKFIGLKGKTISRQDFEDLQKEARKGGYFRLDEKIMALLKNYPNQTSFTIKQVDPDSLQLKGESTLNGLEQLPFNFSDGFTTGLNKAVSSDDIYQYITDTLLELISTDKQLPWQKGWETGIPGLAATNFESKKAYRGINAVMLNMVYPEFPAYAYDIPYFLTFKQIEKLGGTLQKGAKGYRVIYYTILYKWADAEAKLEFGTYNKAKFIRWLQANKARLNILKSGNDIATVVRLATVPIMKYYNIFNADKIDGIDWKLEELKEEKPIVPIDTAEQIVEAWEDKPPIAHKGDAAFYRPSNDSITMPPKSQFNAMEQYYGTLFHEMIHSTGHPKRLNRDMGGGMQTKSYAFEELIAELGASFINGESGILFFNLNNSAAYLKGWRKRLETNMKGDNKFFFRASSRAQAAADLILDRSEEGIPKYLRDDKTKDKIIKEAIDNSRSSKKEKPSRKKDGKKALAKPNPQSKKPKEQQLSLVLNGKKKRAKD
jgi:antirestriction protein ArdC